MATRIKGKLGYEDYARLPSGDGKRYEVLDGALYATPAPSPLHQRLSKRLQRRLEDYFEVRGLGEVFNAPIDVLLAQHDIVEPDLVIGDQQRHALDGARRDLAGLSDAPARPRHQDAPLRRPGCPALLDRRSRRSDDRVLAA